MLSKGVLSRATLTDAKSPIKIVVDGDPMYKASTTAKAIELLLAHHDISGLGLVIEQSMQVPVGCGFGASAAAAVSGVYSVAKVLALQAPKSDLAYHAHVADIVQQTGLGTVSVTFDGVGAGAITRAGSPGFSKFVNVVVPEGTRLVTASLAPYRKVDALSDPALREKINKLGNDALGRFVQDPRLNRLAEQGELFSDALGLTSPEVASLLKTAKSAGASFASQNMIGHAIHALTTESQAAKVSLALQNSPFRPRVDVFEVGKEPAHAYD